MTMITIDRYLDLTAAEIARMRLEAEGVPVLLHAAGHASLMGGLAVGGILLQVPAEYEDKARSLLQQAAG